MTSSGSNMATNIDFIFPPNTEFIENIEQYGELKNYHHVLEDILNSENKIMYFDVSLFSTEKKHEIKHIVFILKILFSANRYIIELGTDDYEIIYNFLLNKHNIFNNAIILFNRFIKKNINNLYDQLTSVRQNYYHNMYFTKSLVYDCLKSWIIQIAKTNFFDTMCMDIIEEKYIFDNMKYYEAYLEYLKFFLTSVVYLKDDTRINYV